MKKILIKNGRIIDPSRKLDENQDILIQGGKIARMSRRINDASAEVIDASRFVVAPGFIDMHVHLREPGREDEETIESGARAAAAGGFTSIVCMPNTKPPNDNPSVTEYIVAQAKKAAIVNVFPVGCVSKGRKGEEIAEIGLMRDAGIVAVSDDGAPVRSSELMRRALEYTKMFDMPVIEHCEELSLAAGWAMNEGEISTRLGLAGLPAASEEIAVERAIILARLTGGKLHIAHLSTRGGVERVRHAKQDGVRVSAEVTPHHIALSDEACMGYDPNFKMNPPLRTADDIMALIEGIRDGSISAIASDHAPHHADEKTLEFDKAPFGVIGLETAVPVVLDRLVHSRLMGIAEVIPHFTTGPAAILGISKGTLEVGADADLTLLDLQRSVKVDRAKQASLSSNTPFHGGTFRGGPVMTIVEGRIVWSAVKEKTQARKTATSRTSRS